MVGFLSKKELILVGILASILLLVYGCRAHASREDAVSFSVIEKIAVDNARSLCGDVYGTGAIPYYGLDDEVIAYMFNFSIEKKFPPHDQVRERAERARIEGKKEERWGVDAYCHLIVAARRSMPTIPAYSKCLSEEFACDRELEQMAKSALGTSTVELRRIYYITPSQKWYVYGSGEEDVFIKIFPPPAVYSEDEFNLKVREEFGLPKGGDFDELWEEFESGKTLSLKADHYIPMQEQCPFYDWSYGCSPTAAAMLLAYWDNYGLYSPDNYARFVDFHFERWDGIQVETDYQVPNLQLDLALAMNTDTLTGSTSHSNIPTGMVYVANAINGYSFTSRNVYGTSAQLWDTLTTEINAGRPCHCSVPGHSITGIGYTDDQYVILHNTWYPPNDFWYYTELSRVGPVIPGSAYGYTVKVTSPVGDTAYNHNGNGEVWHAGGTYEIRWDRDASSDYVMIWFSAQGGRGIWSVIKDYATNDGSWYWTIPPGTSTSRARIAVDLREDGTGAVLGCDGSLGNFIIQPPAAITVTPDHFDTTLIQGTIAASTMTIRNTGSDTLHFSIADATGQPFKGMKGMEVCISHGTNNSPTDPRRWSNPERYMDADLWSPIDLSPNLPGKHIVAYPDEHGATVGNVYNDVAPYLPESSISGIKAQGDWIFDFSCGTESDYCVGVEFAGGHFYVTAGQRELKVFEYDQNGYYTGFSFDQFRTSNWGWRDLAWDGLHLYAGDDDGNVTEFGTNGTDYGDFAGPTGLGCVRALAYDPVEDVFYTANFSSDIYRFTKINPDIAAYPQTPDTFAIYGMAYDGDSPGGPCLWIAEQTTNSVRQWNIATQSYTGIAFAGSGIYAGGCTYSRDWNYPVGVVFYMAQAHPDRVIGYQIPEDAEWLSQLPGTGSIPPGGNVDITVTFDATAVSPHDYSANIIISSNDPGNPVVTVPAYLTVVPQDTMYMWAEWAFTPPTIDGNIEPAEWASAAHVDISDTLGQLDDPDPPGTAYLYVMNDGDRLYMAVDYPADVSLDDTDQIGLYFDENNDDVWAIDSSEGNYWVYWHPDSARTVYRTLPSGYRMDAPPGVLGKIASTPNLQYEASMPFGTEIYELTAGPGDTMGLYSFALDYSTNTFGGWWQQTMPNSKWIDPAYYGRIVLALPPPECTVHVADGWGAPDSTYNPMDVGLENGMAISAILFTLTFDSNLLAADAVTPTPRSSHMDFRYDTWSDSIRVFLYSTAGDSILPGSGSIVEVLFDVDISAIPGDSTLVHVEYVDAADPGANPVPANTEDGWFHFLATPATPDLVAPDSGSFITDNTPTFDWTDASGMTFYWLQVDDDSTFSSPVIDESALTFSTYTPAGPLSDSVYYWQVCAGNGFAWSGWSPSWLFTIDSETPGVPLLISPADSVVLGDNTPAFVWSKVTKVTIFSEERERNSRSAVLADKATEITYSLRVILNGDTATYQTADTGFVVDDTLSDSTFLWEVQAEDEAGNESGYSSPFILFIDTQPPQISNTTVWGDTSFLGPFPVQSTITDDRGIGNAGLWYKTSVDTNWVHVSMDTTGLPLDQYEVEIPSQIENTTVWYYVSAEDIALPSNKSINPPSGPDSSYSFIAGYTGVAESPLQTPETFFIAQNHPNPFEGATQIRYALPEDSWVDIAIYSLSGQRVAVLVNEERESGYYSLTWDGRDGDGRRVSSGVYFVRFVVRPREESTTEEGEYIVTKKLSVMR